MLAVLFGLAILASLTTTALIGLGILPASPLVMSVVFVAHAVFALGFFRGYSGYRALHRLVHEGRGELYDIAITHRIRVGHFKAFREHYLLRRLEGLALCGLSLRAIEAAEAHRVGGLQSARSKLAAAAAEAEANLALGQLGWASQALERTKGVRGQDKHAGLTAMRGRLAFLRGDAERAAALLEHVRGAGEWPLQRVVSARNRVWYADALNALERHAEASSVLQASRPGRTE